MVNTRIIGITALELRPAEGSMGDASTLSPAGSDGLGNTGKTPESGGEMSRQDWLDIFLSVAEKLDFPLSKIQLNGLKDGGIVLCVLLPGVRQGGGELVID